GSARTRKPGFHLAQLERRVRPVGDVGLARLLRQLERPPAILALPPERACEAEITPRRLRELPAPRGVQRLLRLLQRADGVVHVAQLQLGPAHAAHARRPPLVTV